MSQSSHAPSPLPPPGSGSYGSTATGLDPKVAAMLAYLVGWVTGVLFLLLERDNRYVRFHAMQSILALGSLWAVGVGFWILAFVTVFVSASGFRVMLWMAEVTWVVGVIVWLVCLFKAYTGEWWKIPVAGDLAERLAAR